ncbi:hypothetical protein DFH07DRAFT_778698 [Mycena maculata]|uniref:Uncharacterized protein n=1 Tax=Mycena maculata TaxID=230809 RepID=A0AAD7IBK4_9AGAR|nr:hypothetical protein DFH07DRAFT_778698 [Mycena maculata]
MGDHVEKFKLLRVMSSAGNSIIFSPNPSPEVGLQSTNQRLVINLFEVRSRSRLAQRKFQINFVLLNVPEPLHAVNATNKHVCKANPHIQTAIKTWYFRVCVEELDMGNGEDLRGSIWWNLRPRSDISVQCHTFNFSALSPIAKLDSALLSFKIVLLSFKIALLLFDRVFFQNERAPEVLNHLERCGGTKLREFRCSDQGPSWVYKRGHQLSALLKFGALGTSKEIPAYLEIAWLQALELSQGMVIVVSPGL